MQKRPFGNTGFQTTPVAFGAMRITGNGAGISKELLYALEKGINFIDTARNYGESERIIGATLKEWKGERPFIATKVIPRDTANWRFYVPLEEQFTPESITRSVEDSLKTLGVDCLDLIQLHQWYYLWGQRPEWLETLKKLQTQGKVHYIGVSAQDHEHDAVLQLVDGNRVDAVQVFMNVFESRPFVSTIPLCEQRKVAVIARCIYDHSGALAAGGDRDLLSRDVKLSNASPEIVTEYINRIDRLKEEICGDGMTLSELAVRFALSRPGVSNVAASMSSPERIDQAIQAAAKGPLAEDLFQYICRHHVWVKNFYYFSKATVDGNKPG